MDKECRKKNFRITSFKVFVSSKGKTENGKISWKSVSEACVKLEICGLEMGSIQEYRTAEGDGPVNALDNALRKCLLPHFPYLSGVKLNDYSVTISGGKKEGTSACVVVLSSFSENGKSWITKETSTDIINASFHALVDGYRQAILILSGEYSNPHYIRSV